MDFEKAIEVADPASAFEDLDIDAIVVEDTYDGVRLEDQMTQKFIDDMIERFKNGKKIHRKYAFQIVKNVLDIVKAEPTMVEIGVPDGTTLTICGDTHGTRRLSLFSPDGGCAVFYLSVTNPAQVNISICSRSSDLTAFPQTLMHIFSTEISSIAARGRPKLRSCFTLINGFVRTSFS